MMYAGKKGRERNDGSDKAKNVKFVIKRLWKYLTYYKSKLILALFLTILSNGLSLIGPYLTGEAIDAMDGQVDFQRVYLYAGLMVAFYILAAVFNYLLRIAMVHVSQSVVYKMRKDLFEKLNRVEVSYFDTKQTGDIISRMSYDIDSINTSLATDVISILTSVITVTISLVMMIIMSPVLVVVFVLTIPLSVTITRVLSKIVKKRYRLRNQKLGEINGFAEEMITGQRTIQSYVQEQNVLNKFDIINEETAKATYQAGYYGTIVGPSVNFVSNLSVALVGVLGGILYFKNLITIGKLTSFTLYSRRFSGPINQMSSVFTDIQSALAAAERVFAVLDAKEEDLDDLDVYQDLDIKGEVEVKHLDFSYVENQPILKDVSFHAPQGKVVAIVGQTGAGKTTLVNLLMRFYESSRETIFIDDIDIYKIPRAELRKAFSMVLQDTWVFYGTIHDNIAYGNGEISRLEVEEAAKKARIHQFIVHLPQGYDTLLTDEGLNISKGQKQLLVIARAMLSKSKMLILDEATSNVDTHTEVQIQQAMLKLMQNKTSFVIAHRLSTIRNAQLILVVDDGNIVEQGTHESLLNQKGVYYELYNSQFA